VEELADPQVAFLLLRHCAYFSKLVYAARAVPFNARAAAHDGAVRKCLEEFSSLRLTNNQWEQAKLSTKHCSLGLRNVEDHCAAAYLSSRSACHSLCQQLDPEHIWEVTIPGSSTALAVAAVDSSLGPGQQLLPRVPELLFQRDLSLALNATALARFKDLSRADLARRARLNLIGASVVGQWLRAQPSDFCKNQVEPTLYRTMLQRWLRCKILYSDHFCPRCDDVVDVYGDDCLVCSGGGDQTKRHNFLRNTICHKCVSARLAPELEKPGLLQTRPYQGPVAEDGVRREGALGPAGKRPADVYVPRWRGRHASRAGLCHN
jgi:hypothetical protein